MDALEEAKGAGTLDVVTAAQNLVVQVLLGAGRNAEAEAFAAEQGLTDDAVAEALVRRRELDLYNEGVDAYNAGDFDLAAARFRDVADGSDDGDPRRTSAAKNLLSSLLLRGAELRDSADDDAARAAYDEAATRGWAAGRPVDSARALLAIAEMLIEAGDGASAVAFTERAEAAARSAQDSGLEGRAHMTAGDAQYDTNADAAAAAFTRALTVWGDGSDTLGEAATVSYNLAVLLAESDTAEAVRLLERCVALAGAAGDATLSLQAKDALAQLESR